MEDMNMVLNSSKLSMPSLSRSNLQIMAALVNVPVHAEPSEHLPGRGGGVTLQALVSEHIRDA
jgi:hypothetical protein